jgi:hypothetical protein
MQQSRRCRVRKLSNRIGDPKPSCRPTAVTIRREFVGALGAFQHRFFAVAREQPRAPNVDFRDHDGRLSGIAQAVGLKNAWPQLHALANASISDTAATAPPIIPSIAACHTRRFRELGFGKIVSIDNLVKIFANPTGWWFGRAQK